MPYAIQSITGRAALLGSLGTLAVLFGLWFTSSGPFARPPMRSANPGAEDGPARTPSLGPPSGPPLHYPPLRDSKSTQGAFGAEPDFDPLARPGAGPSQERILPELLRLLPQGYSVLGMVRVDALRKQPWAASILSGRRLPRLRSILVPLAVNPMRVSRAVFGVELEARAPSAGPKTDTRFLAGYDRPFCLVVEGRQDRKRILQEFRNRGPLAASVVMGRRVYRREGDYSLVFPVRGLVAWSYRRPMGPVLQTMLEDASRSAYTPAIRAQLREGGFPFPSPRVAPRPHARRAPAPRRASPDARRRPPPSRRRAPAPKDVDSGLPWVTLLWTAQPGRRIPYPFNRLKGYGAKSALRGVVLTIGPSGPASGRVRGHLRLLYQDAVTPTAVSATFRYVRRYIAQNARIRRAKLNRMVDAATVEVFGKEIRVTAELRAWHVRALMLMFHKLLESGRK